MRNYFLYLLMFATSCNNNDILIIKPDQIQMESTILAGDTIRIKKNGLIKRNDIVAIKTPKNEIQILRVIGLPGDEIEIKKGDILINGQKHNKPLTAKEIYTVYLRNPANFSQLDKFKNRPYSDHYRMFSLSQLEYEEILRMNVVDSIYILGVDSTYIQQGILTGRHFKYSNNFYFGPVKIPKVNSTINEEIISVAPLYLSESDLKKTVNEQYFFCIGDNYPEAIDSRFFGLISENDVIGVIEVLNSR